MNEKPLTLPGTRQRWALASRPKTLPAAASPVLVGWAIALKLGIRAVPTTLVVKDGIINQSLLGKQPKTRLKLLLADRE